MALTERKAPRPRGEGQWGLGYHEPLNVAEQIKKEDDGPTSAIGSNGSSRRRASARSANRTCAAGCGGGASTRSAGRAFPASTGSAELEELEDEFFMMRIRMTAGCSPPSSSERAWASERYGSDVADITDRQNVQLHWIRIEDVPAVWERIEATGLSTAGGLRRHAASDAGCPLAGVAATRSWTLPRRSARSEAASSATPPSATCRASTRPRSGAALALREPRDQRRVVRRRERPRSAGFDLWVGGGLSTNPNSHSGWAFVPPARCPSRGPGSPPVPRLRVPANAQPLAPEVPRGGLGRRAVPRGAREGVPPRPLPDGEAPAHVASAQRDHVGVFEQHDGRSYVGFAPNAGRLRAPALPGRRPRDRYGSGRMRTTTQQKLVILDVRRARGRVGHATGQGRPARRPSTFRKGMMACTGIEFCKLAIGETKGRAQWLYKELDAAAAGVRRGDPDPRERLPELLREVPGRRYRADVGAATRPDGTRSDAFLVHLGGASADGARSAAR